jgi:hypothetical protein
MAKVKIGYKDGSNNFIAQQLHAADVLTVAGVSAEVHITDAGIHLTGEQADKIAAALTVDDIENLKSEITVENYAALVALTSSDVPVNGYVFVEDASGDATVGSGWAVYKRIAAATDVGSWFKTAEQESMDVAMVDQTARDAASSAATAAGNAASAASAAQDDADAAASAAGNAQTTASNAAAAAALLDAAYCTSESDMQSKNLRTGALVIMAV